MSINTKRVQGRRTLRFNSMEEIVADAESLVTAPQVKMLGNWSLNELIAHLAIAINGSIDGVSEKVPWFVRMIGRLVKQRVLDHKMSPGFRLPTGMEAKFFPKSSAANEALNQLRAAVARLQTERMTAKHPVLGSLTHEEWTRLHLRHSELHLSFATIH